MQRDSWDTLSQNQGRYPVTFSASIRSLCFSGTEITLGFPPEHYYFFWAGNEVEFSHTLIFPDAPSVVDAYEDARREYTSLYWQYKLYHFCCYRQTPFSGEKIAYVAERIAESYGQRRLPDCLQLDIIDACHS